VGLCIDFKGALGSIGKSKQAVADEACEQARGPFPHVGSAASLLLHAQ
jgi:hypothetical protein